MKLAFTMAEILLSLTIIGVVAAITLPSLTGNINERTWNTQRKALYARISQAISLMPALNCYGTLDDTTDTAAETFITSGLAKVLKINNICDSEHLKDCGIPQKFLKINGSLAFSETPKTLADYNNMFSGSFSQHVVVNSSFEYDQYYEYNQKNTKAAAFETVNGESILIYYNPQCKGNMNESKEYYSQEKMCANFVYDLNGTKGPNTVGKDIGFISVIYPTDSVVVAPMPTVRNELGNNQIIAGKECRKLGDDNRLANIEEGMSLFYNVNITGMKKDTYWSSSRVTNDSSKGWIFNLNTGTVTPVKITTGYNIWCVKR